MWEWPAYDIQNHWEIQIVQIEISTLVSVPYHMGVPSEILHLVK